MRSNRKNRRLVPPASLKAAVTRCEQLATERRRIFEQLRDPERANDTRRYPTTGDYDAWKVAAQHAARVMHLEEKQLIEWIRQRLFDEMCATFNVLAQDVDLEPEEVRLLERVKAFKEIEKRSQFFDA